MKKKIPSFSEEEIAVTANIGAITFLDNISKKFSPKDRTVFISNFLSSFLDLANEGSVDVFYRLEVVPK